MTTFPIRQIRTLNTRKSGEVSYFDGTIVVDGVETKILIHTKAGDAVRFLADRQDAVIAASPEAEAFVAAAVEKREAQASAKVVDDAYRATALADAAQGRVDAMLESIRADWIDVDEDAELRAAIAARIAKAVSEATAERPAFGRRWNDRAEAIEAANAAIRDLDHARNAILAARQPKRLPIRLDQSTGELRVFFPYDAARLARFKEAFAGSFWNRAGGFWSVAGDFSADEVALWIEAENRRAGLV